MRNECNIIRDILPLYVEDMVSEDTRSYVEEHLQGCSQCKTQLEELETGRQTAADAATDIQQRKESTKPLAAIRKKMRKRINKVQAITIICIVCVFAGLHYFPVYRLWQIQPYARHYQESELAMLAYIGSREDRDTAQSVMRLADAAFSDYTHTREEDRKLYGNVLGGYSIEAGEGVVSVKYSLKLLSAHLNETDGYLWVYYSYAGYDAEGNVVEGSSNVFSLWIVEKQPSGQWVVVGKKEAP